MLEKKKKNKFKILLHKNISDTSEIINYRKTNIVDKEGCFLSELYYFSFLIPKLGNKAALMVAEYSVDDSNSVDDVPLDFCAANHKDLHVLGYGNNLELLCGEFNIPDIANIPFMQSIKLIKHILEIVGIHYYRRLTVKGTDSLLIVN